MELGKVDTTKMTGEESFHIDGKSLNFDLLSFWQWSSSDLLTNRQRGILAEYIVASALKLTSKPREDWDAYDLITDTGLKIEVKSSAYVQSWEQDKLSTISFGIQPTIKWNEEGIRTTEKVRQAEVYVFCVLTHTDEKTINPIDLDQWDFYILDTDVLNSNVTTQKTITLSSLMNLSPIQSTYQDIHSHIKEIEKRKVLLDSF